MNLYLVLHNNIANNWKMRRVKIEPNKIYFSPLIIGPVFEQGKLPGLVYGEVQMLALRYETDYDAAQALLPDCYQPAKKPAVTVSFGYYGSVDFLAGGGYNIAIVAVDARFDGEKDHVEGGAVLLILEDDMIPITGGREHLGAPKLFSDISSIRTLPDGGLRCETSRWGRLLFGIDVGSMKKQNVLVRSAAGKRLSEQPMLGYKYVPSLDGPPDASYPTLFMNDYKIDELWLGKTGDIFFGEAAEDDLGWYKKFIDALKTLPVRKVTQTVRFRGSQVLRYDLYRRLK
jgi:acetoacetate decarboxylase